MPFFLTCSSCGQKLRFADHYAGQEKDCPKCGALISIPAEQVPQDFPSSSESQPDEDQWLLNDDRGVEHGPMPRAELDRMQASGRINSNCQIRRVGAANWQWAGEIYPDLNADAFDDPFLGKPTKPAKQSTPPAQREFEPRRESQREPQSSHNPYASPRASTSHRRAIPHRGGLLLMLAIFGWACCPIFGGLAWLLANEDLQRMD
ncbi:MAG: DUF4339 domain-containing protein, partial [Planctomycetales bacterium]